MDINLKWDPSVLSLAVPSGFRTAVQAAATYLDHLITNNVTVNINVGWGEITLGGQTTQVGDGESEGGPEFGQSLSYAQVVADLKTHDSAADQAALAALPASDPTDGGTFGVSNAQAKAWGLMSASPANDGSVGFGASSAYNYTGQSISQNQVDFIGIAEHELTHALGRMAGLNQSGYYSAFDLFRYSASGVLDVNGTSSSDYFSLDGGKTNLDTFASSSDLGDWASSGGNDSFDAIGSYGVVEPMTATDDKVMSAIGFQVSCFAAGTRIATVAGDIAVEALRVGDMVTTVGGVAAPVVWLGHRRVDCRRHPRPHDVWPVRVRAHAFGQGRPAGDLILSPDHAVFVRGCLVPIRYLLNGVTVVQEQADSIEYWHVELPRHGVLLAEGLACESYLDTGNRAGFAGASPIDLHPDFARRVWDTQGCAPLLLEGPRVIAARRQLLARAARLGYGLDGAAALSVLADGTTLPLGRDGARCVVRLPAGARELRLRSRGWTPAHMQPDSRDTRTLGIALGRLWLDGREAALDSPALTAGWHAPEDGWRWTDGDAALHVAGIASVAFEVARTGRYWVAAPAPRRRAAGR